MWILLIASMLSFNGVAYFMPKVISRLQMFVSFFTSMMLLLEFDSYVDFKYNLYGYFDKGIDWRGGVATFGIIPAVVIIFLNLFPYNKPILNKIIFLFSCMIYCVIYEIISVKIGFFYWNGWKLWWSIPMDLILFGYALLMNKIVRKLLDREKGRI
jgi:hypothetical protein